MCWLGSLSEGDVSQLFLLGPCSHLSEIPAEGSKMKSLQPREGMGRDEETEGEEDGEGGGEEGGWKDMGEERKEGE